MIILPVSLDRPSSANEQKHLQRDTNSKKTTSDSDSFSRGGGHGDLNSAEFKIQTEMMRWSMLKEEAMIQILSSENDRQHIKVNIF